MNIEIIGFALGFWIRLRFLRYSLWNKDLLDTHLALLDTDFTSKNCVCLGDVLKTSSRRLQRNNFSSSSSERSWKRLRKTSSRHLQNVLEDVKLLRWRRVEDFFKTCLQDVFKTSWRPTNVCWETWIFFGHSL